MGDRSTSMTEREEYVGDIQIVGEGFVETVKCADGFE